MANTSSIISAGGAPAIRKFNSNSNTNSWVRPADWLSLPVLQSTDNKFVGLFAVTNDASNLVALTCTVSSGSYTVDWGDGSSPQTYTSGTNASYQYTYSSVNSSVTSTGWKQVIVKVYPTTSGSTLNTFSLQVLPSGYVGSSTSVNWVDIAIAGQSLTSVLFATTAAGSSSFNVSLSLLRQITIYSLSSTYASLSYFCYGLSTLKSFIFYSPSSSCTDFSYMFYNCFELVNLNKFDTSAGINLSYMFTSCYLLNSIPLFNTASATNMTYMFYTCYSLTSLPLLNTANVTNFVNFLGSCYSLTTIPSLNTSSGTSFSSMFINCRSLTSAPSLNTANGTGFGSTFYGCGSLSSAALSGTRYSIGYNTAPKLARNELVAIFNGLGTAAGAQTINITNCYGASSLSSGDRAIATGKGWTITG